MERRYYKESEICKLFGICRSTARKYYSYAIYRIGRCIRYDMWEIERRESENT